MDLAKIISDLRMELNCLNAAIVAVEELARVQKQLEPAAARQASSAGEGPLQPDGPPVKRGRGRPRKRPAEPSSQPQAQAPEPVDTVEQNVATLAAGSAMSAA